MRKYFLDKPAHPFPEAQIRPKRRGLDWRMRLFYVHFSHASMLHPD